MQISDVIIANKVRGALNWQVLNESIAFAPVANVCRPPDDFANENENIENEENHREQSSDRFAFNVAFGGLPFDAFIIKLN